MKNKIVIRGARENNLKNIDVDIPKGKFVVITGMSGSGKSSLAFDIIYSEGQRRYVESLSTYARQFIGQTKKPDVDRIEGLSPSVSIEQKTTNKNPRSTVGTMTEIYDYMRLLYSHIGKAHCPICGRVVQKQSIDEIMENIYERFEDGDKLTILSPILRNKKGAHKSLFKSLLGRGYVRARVNGKTYYLDEEIQLNKNRAHTVDIVIDRVVMNKDSKDFKTRLTQSIEQSILLSSGKVIVMHNDDEIMYSENLSCPIHDEVVIPEITPRLFSFNAPFGACPECNGIGKKLRVDEDKIIVDKEKSILEGGLLIPGASTIKGYAWTVFEAAAKSYGISLIAPVKSLTKEEMNIIFYGGDGRKIRVDYDSREFSFHGFKEFEGIITNLERRYREAASDSFREELEHKYMSAKFCQACNGKKLKPEVLAIKVNGMDISEVTNLPLEGCLNFFESLKLTEKEKKVTHDLLEEIKKRIKFLIDVGLGYLNLSRETKTLSGGETQRIRLASQIGSGLTGVIYVLDEPSIGLHQRDNDRLISTLRELKELENTLIVVEHDEDTIMQADYVIDMGPEAGMNGGEIIAQGTPKMIMNNKKSITGKYLKGIEKIEIPKKRRRADKHLMLRGATGNNLKDVKVDIPLGIFTVITGVSGSGKSTLINQTLSPILANKLNGAREYALPYLEIAGVENLDRVVEVDQTPLGKTPRSTPATYTKVLDDIREIFAQTSDACYRGFSRGRFSFNIKGGRCEVCQGAGLTKIEMMFLPDIYVECEICKGKRYNKETLEVYYKGKNIADVLDMSVEEAYDFFENYSNVRSKLQILMDVGLGYIKLGQPANTLSGGEAQRVKLAAELARPARGKTIYIFDEPTTGLHFEDIKKLLNSLERLIEKGNTVVVIEHNLDVIKSADYVIDMGPDGGLDGGCIVVEGTPEEVAESNLGYTSKYIKAALERDRRRDV